jgi:tetratricopeptide (TPR) repeat protein
VSAFYERVIAKDPSFAPAFAGLAMARAIRSGHSPVNLAEELAGMRAAAEKAIQLDPLLAEAHDALAMAYAREAQWERSEKSFRRAIELNPNVWSARVDFTVNLLVPLGRIDELRISEKIEPLEPAIHFLAGWVLTGARRYEEAAGYCRKLPADDAMKTNCFGRVRIGQGRLEEAIQILTASSFPRPWAMPMRGWAAARKPRRSRLRQTRSFRP